MDPPIPRKLFTRRRCLAGMGAAGGAALLPALPASAANEAGVVTEVQGTALADTRPVPRNLSRNGLVFLNELLRTGDQSRLALQLGTSTSVRLGARAKLRIDRFIVDAGGELQLTAGQLLLDGPDGGFPKGLEVRSPYALLAVRGTKFFAGRVDKGFDVFVQHGEVSVRAGGTTVTLRAGDGTTVPAVGARPGAGKQWKPERIARTLALVT